MKNSEFDFDDFVCYAMIYAANADTEIEPSEHQYIADALGESRYQKLLPVYEAESDHETIERILDLRKKFLKAAGGDELFFDAIKRVFKADGKYEDIERQTLEVIKKVFEGE